MTMGIRITGTWCQLRPLGLRLISSNKILCLSRIANHSGVTERDLNSIPKKKVFSAHSHQAIDIPSSPSLSCTKFYCDIVIYFISTLRRVYCPSPCYISVFLFYFNQCILYLRFIKNRTQCSRDIYIDKLGSNFDQWRLSIEIWSR